MKLASLFVSACLLIACSQAPPPTAETTPETAGEGLPDRDPDLALRLVQEEGAVLLDVRTPEEFAGGYAEGATNIPVQQLKGRLADVEALVDGDRETPVVVYCASGGRASRAKAMLLEAGFSRVTNLGGLRDWKGPVAQP